MATTYTSDVLLEYCVYLRGDNIPLAMAEIESLAHLVDSTASIQWKGRLGKVSCKLDPIPFLVERSVLLREAGKILLSCEDSSICSRGLENIIWLDADSPDIRFAVRVQDTSANLRSSEKESLASIIGEYILSVTDWSVSLKHPNRKFTLFVGSKYSFLCESSSSDLFKWLEQTSRKSRTFFHPSMMNATLARVMCNIAGAMPGYTLLDPFCGGGGILVEAAKIGSRAIGIDTNWRLLNGARENLQSIPSSDFSIVQGDARHLPLSYVDCIVTDPPYGRTSSTRGAKATELVSIFSESLRSWDHPPVVCICGDTRMKLASLFMRLGGQTKYRVSIPVHSSLTREILLVVF